MEVKKLNIPYSIWILALFGALEVLLLKTNNALKLSLSILEYLFVLVVFLQNREVGIMYFFSFILLTIGALNYNGHYEDTPLNFWGVRFAGFSVSILFTVLLTVMILLERNRNNLLTLSAIVPRKNYFAQFIVFLIFWGTIVGIIRCFQGINYPDEYLDGILNYTPALFYLILLSRISIENTLKIVKYGIPVSAFMLLLSAITDNRMYYSTETFAVTNAISTCFIIFFVFFWKKYYKPVHWYIMLACMVMLVATNQYMLGGKIAAVFIIAPFCWLVVKMKKKTWILLPLIVLLSFLLSPSLAFFASFFDNGSIISGKILQVKTAYDMILDPLAMAQIKSSVGVTVGGEMVTVGRHLWEHPSVLLFGEGFGGGVPDYYGVLGWSAGHGGFDMDDLKRNCFTKMHLPIFEMPLQGGLIVLFAYLRTLYKILFSKPYAMNIILFLSLLLVFYITKEFILLTLLLAKLATETNSTTILSNENKRNYSNVSA